MSPARPPMQPPDLPGFEHVRLLGSGGYADVFLYEQQMPRRQVAIKVLLTEAYDDEGRSQFFDEANSMASVSTHPFIVSVFHAEVSSDGHPYLVMEYYPRDNFSVRARNEQIPVFEALRVGVQVASAVETAHRAGILHRDIKPANILTSEYDRPGLTDFGIATAATGGGEAEGMSIPWSPPEVVNGSAAGDATADVYSLAATVHTLLSGRSPFEVPGGSNRTFDLIPRIEAGSPQPTGRADVPESVERILRHGMSRSASDRPASAAEFARMLQAAEVELGLTPTQLEIRQDPRDVRARGMAEDEDGTRLKGPKVIQSQGETDSGPGQIVTGAPGGAPPGSAAAYSGTDLPANAGEGTIQRGSAQPGAAPGMISGVGARPVGLAGAAGPRPVAPMPSGHEGDRSFDASDYESGAAPTGARPGMGDGSKRDISWPRLVVGVVVGVGLLVGLGFAFSGADDEPECPGDPECPTPPSTQDPEPPAVDGVPNPFALTLEDLGDGQKKVRWTHDGVDLDAIEYEIRRGDINQTIDTVSGSDVTVESAAEVSGIPSGIEDATVLSATVETDVGCVEVWAHVEGGTNWGASELVC